MFERHKLPFFDFAEVLLDTYICIHLSNLAYCAAGCVELSGIEGHDRRRD